STKKFSTLRFSSSISNFKLSIFSNFSFIYFIDYPPLEFYILDMQCLILRLKKLVILVSLDHSFNKCGCSYMLPMTSTCSSSVPNLENEQNVSLFPFPLFNSNLHLLSLYST